MTIKYEPIYNWSIHYLSIIRLYPKFQKSLYDIHRQAKHQEALYLLVNGKYFPSIVPQVGPEQPTYLITNNSGTMFRWKRNMLNPVDYTATPDKSAKAAIICPVSLAFPSWCQNVPRPPRKCIQFAELLCLIDYMAVQPGITEIDVPMAYLEPDSQERDTSVVIPLTTLLPED